MVVLPKWHPAIVVMYCTYILLMPAAVIMCITHLRPTTYCIFISHFISVSSFSISVTSCVCQLSNKEHDDDDDDDVWM